MGPRLAAQIGDYSNLNPTKYITRLFSKNFMFLAINAQEVKDLIQNLKSNKASVGIPNKCIRLAVDHNSEAVTKVFNCSLVQGIMPDVLKVLRVAPIDKGGDAADPSIVQRLRFTRSNKPLISLSTRKFQLIYKNITF